MNADQTKSACAYAGLSLRTKLLFDAAGLLPAALVIGATVIWDYRRVAAETGWYWVPEPALIEKAAFIAGTLAVLIAIPSLIVDIRRSRKLP